MSVAGQEQAIDALIKAGLDSMTATDKERLDKVLFPDTHVQKVTFLGGERDLRPLPVKYAKLVHAQMMPFATKAIESDKAESDDRAFEADEILSDALTGVAKTLCGFYGWGDEVEQKIQSGNVTTTELQALVSVQTNVNGANDFLLAPLRLAVKIMRVRALMDVVVNNLSPTTQDESMNKPNTPITQS